MADIGVLQIGVGLWWLQSYCSRLFVLQGGWKDCRSDEGGIRPVIDCCAAILLCLAAIGSVLGVVLLQGVVVVFL